MIKYKIKIKGFKMIQVKHVRKEYLKGKRISKETDVFEVETVRDLHNMVKHLASTSTMHTTIGVKGDNITYSSMVTKQPKHSFIDSYKVIK